MTSVSKITRRDFLAKTGLSVSGLSIAKVSGMGFTLGTSISTSLSASASTTGAAGLEFNVFVHIASDNSVAIVAHRSEMGQGVRTSLPQIVADEMDADWSLVNIIQAQADKKYGNQNTDGSASVRDFYQKMREMGATARWMLRQAAAKTWQVPFEQCETQDHRVIHSKTERSLSYGELAEAAAKETPPKVDTLRFKADKEHRYIGKSISMVDLPAIVSGNTTFGIDVLLPDMHYASIERCPVVGGKVKHFNADAARKIKGVVDVIEIKGGTLPAQFHPLAGIAVIATNTWSAQQGRENLEIEWDLGANAHYDTDAYLKQLSDMPLTGSAAKGKTVRQRGDVSQAYKNAADTFEASYLIPHLEHATMEPPAAAAVVQNGKCEVWAPVQTPQRAQDVVAATLGMKPEKVTINVTLLGGAFGRKAKPDFVAEAAWLAQQTGKAIKVTWTREDTVRHGYYHACSVQQFKAGMDAKGKIIAIEQHIASPTIMSTFQPGANLLQDFELGQGYGNIPYDVPNILAKNHEAEAHVRIGWMRSVYNINHAFAVNSFVDEVARKYQQDPLQYQLDMIGDDRTIATADEGFPNFAYWKSFDEYPLKSARLKGAIQAVKESAGWISGKSHKEGWGLAAHPSFLSYVAVATKVRMEKGALAVEEVHISIDCGKVVNPDRVRSQMEGSVIFGLSLALHGEITAKHGAIEQSNFDDYPVLRMRECPRIKVVLVDSQEAPTGVGEPGVPPVAPSLTSAIAAAGGPRIRSLPVRRHLDIA